MPEPTRFTDGTYLVAQTSTPLEVHGPACEAFAAPDGWCVNVHFCAGEQGRTYVFDVEQAERFIDSVQQALPAARLARGTPSA